MEDSADITTSPDSESHKEKGPSSRIKQNHPPEDIVGNLNELTLRKHTIDKCVANFVSYSCYLSQVEPTKVEEALQDESWVEAMHDELLQFQRNDVWILVPRPEGEHIIGTKWISAIRLITHHQNSPCFGFPIEVQVLSDGCKDCFLKWATQKRFLCGSTKRIH